MDFETIETYAGCYSEEWFADALRRIVRKESGEEERVRSEHASGPLEIDVHPFMDARSYAIAWAAARAALLGFLVLGALGVSDGGYWPENWGWAALALLWLAALALVLRAEIRLGMLEVGMIGSLAAFLAWTVASHAWASTTHSPLEGQRTLVYLGALCAVLLVVRSRSWGALLGGAWAAITVVSGYGLATRLFPERLGVFNALAGYRLSEPLGYWNALGIFAALGTLLAIGFAARGRSVWLRAAAAASLLVVLPTLYFTYSRGAWIALGFGVIAALALDLRRLQFLLTLLLVIPWPAAGVWFASQSEALTTRGAPLSAASSEGRRLTLVLLALGAGAALTAGGLAVLERRVSVPRALRAAYAAVLIAAVAAALLAVFDRHGSPPTIVRNAYDAFTVRPPPEESNLNRRLFNLSGNGRDIQWRVAWREFRDNRWLGSGAGSYEQYWLAHRPLAGKVRDAHSLYLETLAELGPFGLGLLVATLAFPLVAAVRIRREPLAAAAFGAYVAYLVHAGVDWDWEMTAVTLAGLFCGAALIVGARPRGRMRAISSRLRVGALGLVLALTAFGFVGLMANNALADSAEASDEARWADAEREARKAIDWAPWSSEPWRRAGEAQYAQRKLAAARASFREGLEKDPRSWELWFDLALASEGPPAQLRAALRAQALNPLSPELAFLRSALGLDSKRREKTR